jgi:thiamine biosynthesis lipoprotein
MHEDGGLLRHDEYVMGTVVSFCINPGPQAQDTSLALRRACLVLATVDATFSLWRPESPMSLIRKGELDPVDASPEVALVIERCREARDLTDGWFDPWAMPGGLDPTGLVKGWAAVRALEVLTSAGIQGAMVNAGGDVATAGTSGDDRPWGVGITNPDDRRDLVAAVASPGAVATSGTYERGAHIIDPFSGRHRTRLRSASVIGPDLTLADALATALCAAGPAGAGFVERAGYCAIVVDTDGVARTIGSVPLLEE